MVTIGRGNGKDKNPPLNIVLLEIGESIIGKGAAYTYVGGPSLETL